MHEYEKSHPWLTFSVNLSRTPPKVWTLLGECSALCRTLASLPLPEEDRKQLQRDYTIRWIRSSFSTGMQTMSNDDLQAVINKENNLKPSSQYLAHEAGNLLRGIEKIRAGARASIRNRPYPQLILDYNEMALDRLVLPEHMKPGEYRSEESAPVIGTILPAPAGDCPILVERLCEWLSSTAFVAPEEMETIYGIISAILAHLYLRWIQPLWAGNTRTSRLIEYHLLASAEVPDPAALLLGIHYASTPTEYNRQLEKTSGADSKILPFLNYSIEGFRDGLSLMIENAQSMQKNALWRHRINEIYLDKTSPADIRRRRLAVEMCTLERPAPMPKLLEMLPAIAGLYATKTYKTLTRDVNDLIAMRLLKKTPDGIVRG